MQGPMSLRFSTQAQVDIRRITGELTDLQRQVASGVRANDLSGFGSASSRLLSAHGLKASADARSSVLGQLDARLGVQGAALGEVSGASTRLAQAIRVAISANDGRGVGIELDLSFKSIVSALNESWNGQPLFAGERLDGAPVKVMTLEELAASNTPQDIFEEAERRQSIDLGSGPPTEIAPKASEVAGGLMQTLRDLKLLLDGAGGQIGQPIGDAQSQRLQEIAATIEHHADTIVTEEGRTGQLQSRFAAQRDRLQERSDLLVKEIGDHADADLAQVSMRLSALMTQYEASAKTFADLSQLSLLRYL